jgi:hypothetical protein
LLGAEIIATMFLEAFERQAGCCKPSSCDIQIRVRLDDEEQCRPIGASECPTRPA